MESVRHLLASLRGRYNQRELAEKLGVSIRTVRRWEIGETDPPAYLESAIQRLLPLGRVDDQGSDFTFIDLFAGIGGIRKGFEAHGGQCVFTSEWDRWAQKTYLANFPGSTHTLTGDIKGVDARDVPDHDVLLAGFPCQPFSIAGVSKKNSLGRKHGFLDETQGTLFFDVARIIKEKRPKALLLENVKNLVSHDKGNTFRVICKVLQEELGYHIHWKIIDGQHFVPQHRERIIIVGFREATDFTWDDLQLPAEGPRLASILHPEDGSEEAEPHYTVGKMAKVDARYTLSPELWTYLKNDDPKHRSARNGYGLLDGDSVTRTLSPRYYKDGSEILVSQGPQKRPRRLTPRECARLMGLEDSFEIPVSDTQAYRLLANAAVVPMMKSAAQCVVSKLCTKESAIMSKTSIRTNAFPKQGKWTIDQLKLAFYLYCQLPFGKLHRRNPQIVELSNLINRTPSALAMKLVNFASLDPTIRNSGRHGLGNASTLDKAVWDEFHADWESLVVECQQIREGLAHEKGRRVDTVLEDGNDSELTDFTGETRQAIVQQRVKQSFFP